MRFVCVPDEESEDVDDRSTDALVAAGSRGDFAITGEPTDLHIGVQAKGVLAMRLEVHGPAAHGSTPWLGDNAILKAHRRLPPNRDAAVQRASPPSCSTAPRSTWAGSPAATRSTRSPTAARWTSTSATCPARTRRDPRPDPRDRRTRRRRASRARPRSCSRTNPTCWRCATRSAARSAGEALSVGRDGASDAVSFLEAGIPAVEFGPVGGGHHGPEEWVSIASLHAYRQALGDFVAQLPGQLAAAAPTAQPRGAACAPIEGASRERSDARAAAAASRRGGLCMRFAARRPRDRPADGRRGRHGRPAWRSTRRRRRSSSERPPIQRHRRTSSTRARRASRRRSSPRLRPAASTTTGAGRAPRSDTMMLSGSTRTQDATAVLSIPRDLKVDDPRPRRRQDQRRLRDRRPG